MFDAPLRITPLEPSWASARLDAFLWRGERADMAVWLSATGERWVVRSRVRARDGVLHRLRVRSVMDGDVPREVDRTAFELHPDRFVEVGGPDAQHPRSLVLPAELSRDTAVTPDPDRPETVTLRFAGRARLDVVGVTAERNVALLRLGTAESGQDQWMVEGIGEVSLGPADRPPQRWLVAWRAGDQSDMLFAAPRG